jgi:hypothetical protein
MALLHPAGINDMSDVARARMAHQRPRGSDKTSSVILVEHYCLFYDRYIGTLLESVRQAVSAGKSPVSDVTML